MSIPGHAQRPQGSHHAGGIGLPYRVHPHRHRRRRPVQAGVPGDQAEQQDPGHRRSPTAWTASRSRCSSRAPSWSTSPARPARFLAAATASKLRGAAMADVPDGRRRPDAGPGAPLPHLRAREGRVRDQPLYQRGKAALWRDRQAAARGSATWRATNTRSPTSPPSRGCARGKPGRRAEEYPNLKRWFDEIAARPAVQRGGKVLADRRKPITDDKEREILFGARQYERHNAYVVRRYVQRRHEQNSRRPLCLPLGLTDVSDCQPWP